MAHRRVKIKGRRRHCLARLAWSDRRASLGQPRPRSAVDRPVHAATTQQGLVRRRNDGVNALRGDVTQHDLIAAMA
jgi:hypothetical protein